jgi:hypothetical protein
MHILYVSKNPCVRFMDLHGTTISRFFRRGSTGFSAAPLERVVLVLAVPKKQIDLQTRRGPARGSTALRLSRTGCMLHTINPPGVSGQYVRVWKPYCPVLSATVTTMFI